MKQRLYSKRKIVDSIHVLPMLISLGMNGSFNDYLGDIQRAGPRETNEWYAVIITWRDHVNMSLFWRLADACALRAPNNVIRFTNRSPVLLAYDINTAPWCLLKCHVTFRNGELIFEEISQIVKLIKPMLHSSSSGDKHYNFKLYLNKDRYANFHIQKSIYQTIGNENKTKTLWYVLLRVKSTIQPDLIFCVYIANTRSMIYFLWVMIIVLKEHKTFLEVFPNGLTQKEIFTRILAYNLNP